MDFVDGLMKLLQFKRDMGQICTKSITKEDFLFNLQVCCEYEGFAKGHIYRSNDLFLLISKILSKKLNNFCNSASQCKYCGVMMINSTYIPRTYVRRASWNEMVRNVISCRKLLLHTTPPTLFMLQWAKREMLYSTLLRLKSMFDHMGKIITKGHRTSFNSKIVIILIIPFKQNMN